MQRLVGAVSLSVVRSRHERPLLGGEIKREFGEMGRPRSQATVHGRVGAGVTGFCRAYGGNR